jgi:tight adherence protein B
MPVTWLLIFLLSAAAAHLALSLRPRRETLPGRLEELLQRQRGYEMLETRRLPGDPLRQADDPTPVPQPKKVRQRLVETVDRLTAGQGFAQRLQERLLRAGWRLRPAEFLLLQVLVGTAALLFSLAAAPGAWWLLTPLGFLLPRFLLHRAEQGRTKEFVRQMPDALSLMSNSLRSGYSFLQAMDVVSREMPEPIGREFGQVLREMRVNIPLEDALLNLTKRIPSADLDLMVTAVLIQRQVGGNLSEILDKIGETIRDRIRLHGQIRTLTAQGRMSGWIVSLLPALLALAFHFINPAYLAVLFANPVGWVLLGTAGVMQAIGVLVIRQMVNMEV